MGKFNKGDRVKITFEGVVTDQNSMVYWPLEGGLFVAPYSMYRPISIERIEPPLKVGDVVTWGTKVQQWRIVAIEGTQAILWSGTYANNMSLSSLERIA